jgi:hypothetical protein
MPTGGVVAGVGESGMKRDALVMVPVEMIWHEEGGVAGGVGGEGLIGYLSPYYLEILGVRQSP